MGRRSIGGVLALTLSALEAFARNDHCFLDKVNETMLTTRDLLDWPLDPLRPWWTRVVDARIDPKKCERSDYLKCMEGRWRRDGAVTVLLASWGVHPCELADKLRDAPAPYTVVYVGENWGAFSSHRVNRTANWNYWTTKRCGYRGGPPIVVEGPPNYKYGVRPEAAVRAAARPARDWLNQPQLRRVLTTQHHSHLRHPKLRGLPLGIRRGGGALLMALIAGAARPPRTRWLLINNSGWKFRAGINALVASNFRPPLANTYCNPKQCAVAAAKAMSPAEYLRRARNPPDLAAFLEFATARKFRGAFRRGARSTAWRLLTHRSTALAGSRCTARSSARSSCSARPASARTPTASGRCSTWAPFRSWSARAVAGTTSSSICPCSWWTTSAT